VLRIPDALAANPRRDPTWAAWLDVLPHRVTDLLGEWELAADDAPPAHGFCSLVLPVHTTEGRPAALKVAFPHADGAHEHLALRHWAGRGAVELLRADPHRGALLLERLAATDLTSVWDLEACEIVAELYGRLHIPAPPQLRRLPDVLAAATDRLRRAGSALPRRLVEQAIGLGEAFATDPSCAGTLIHTDLHYTNVLAGQRAPWLAIDPKPLSGDPHYELAPMLWNRWAETAGQVRAALRRRFDTLVEVAGLDEERARAWVAVRMVHLAADPDTPADWATRCVAVIKAVQR
jgi:streptomycin 6-kinase